ncbi:S9 family peptidase [Hyphobacterium indicum]|uniref:S9 family peptidase n=1 Tax=Hyphobacterium indicum TaxID=2162714 RepID=UPI001374ECCB|nr:prolyl oligopeptidase family serine peptidase [Hyphobacterium indicum]
MRWMFSIGLVAVSVAAAEAQTPPVEAFARMPAIDLPTLSPDGTHIAYIANDGDARALYILEIDTGERRGVGASSIRPINIIWAGNERVLMIASETQRFTAAARRNPIDVSAAFSVDARDPSNVTQLLADNRLIHQYSINRGNVIAVDHDGGNVYIPAHEAPRQSGVSSSRGSDAIQQPRYSLFRVAADGGAVTRSVQGLPDQRSWFVTPDGMPLAREYFDDERNAYRIDAYRDGSWASIFEAENPTFQSIIWGVTPEDEAALGFYRDGFSVLRTFDLETGNETANTIGLDGRDLSYSIDDPYTGWLIGVAYPDETMQTRWIDDELQNLQNALVGALGDDSATITSWSQDRSRFIVRTNGSADVPTFYVYDDEARSLSILASEYPELEATELGTRQQFDYTARDGAVIQAYLTLPADGGSDLPAIVLPHGGPESYDIGGFDWIAHFLASRGYAVIQPNFRGSDGFGQAFRDAGRGQWGIGVMQHDVTDALSHAIQQGWVDDGRVCIFGGSYGGYAALAGGAFTPDLYSCVAAYAPVTDIGLFLGEVEIRGGGGNWVADAWAEILGGVVTVEDRQHLDEISPIHNTRNFQAPVLLMHGREDSVIPISQSRRMQNALDDAGQDVEYVEMHGADHWMTDYATRLEVLTRLEDFFAEHIGD